MTPLMSAGLQASREFHGISMGVEMLKIRESFALSRGQHGPDILEQADAAAAEKLEAKWS